MDRKVVLLAEVKGVGRKGDVVNVSVGYAANYLLPQHLAVDATPQRLESIKRKRLAESQEKDVSLARARELAASLEGKTVTVSAKATPQGRLYGAVTPDDVVAAVIHQLAVRLDKKYVVIEKPIRTIGFHTVLLKLNPELSIDLSVTVAEA
ncbi:MAG: 50S ribosomal protein L9 [Caldisericota bacterium]|jgi:large subunit ribosomal protein L9|nr:50S ribosomal protein L9 [Caldisericota bacterium]